MAKGLNAAAFPVFTTPRTCARCGDAFDAIGRQYLCRTCRKPERADRSPADCSLSSRELQVVALVKRGKRNREIANDLHLAEGTVKEYMHTIFRKLDIGNRTQLALFRFAVDFNQEVKR